MQLVPYYITIGQASILAVVLLKKTQVINPIKREKHYTIASGVQNNALKITIVKISNLSIYFVLLCFVLIKSFSKKVDSQSCKIGSLNGKIFSKRNGVQKGSNIIQLALFS